MRPAQLHDALDRLVVIRYPDHPNQDIAYTWDDGAFKNQGQHQGQGQGGPPTAEDHTEALVQVGWILFVYDEAGQLIGEYDEQGTPLRQYIWLDNMPIAMRDADGVYFLHTDHLNTPKLATDESGEVVWRADYRPFGKVTETVGEIEVNLRFPGQYHDRETGLHQNWHREYAPGIGRYTQTDPLGLHAGPNLFAYVMTNPLSQSDPTGLYNPERADTSFPRPGPFGGVCGPEGHDIAMWIPDIYRRACEIHDKCYEDCTKTKQQCDDEFRWIIDGGLARIYSYGATRTDKSKAQYDKAREKCKCQ